MRLQVVQHDDVARIVDGAGKGAVAQDSVDPYCAYDGKVLAPIGWLVVKDAFAPKAAAVRRVMATLQPDSSRKIGRSTGTLLSARRKASRFSWTFGRSCSDGRKRFFST